MNMLVGESHNYESPLPVGSHHYVNCFLKDGCKVCWFSGIITPFHFLRLAKKKISFEAWLNGGMQCGGVSVYSPFSFFSPYNIPFLRSTFVAHNALRWTFPPLKRFLSKSGFQSVDILWIANPTMVHLLDIVKSRRSVMRIADDIRGFKNIPPSVQELEVEAIQRVDVVLVTSKALEHKVLEIRKNDVYYIPNAVYFDKFENHTYKLPEEYKAINSPIVVYVGAIREWLDVDLISYSARKLAKFIFVIIGPIQVNIDELRKIPNVLLLGWRDPKFIPNYLKYANVGIIPFKKNKLTDAVNPIKCYEYFACGLPVVATNLQELANMKSPILIATDNEEFVSMIKVACSEKDKNLHNYIAFAQSNSWTTRYEKVKAILGI